MTELSLRRIQQGDRCLNNTRNPHLPCAVRPYGVTEDEERCADFDADPTVPVEEQWELEGASFYKQNHIPGTNLVDGEGAPVVDESAESFHCSSICRRSMETFRISNPGPRKTKAFEGT